MKIKNMLNYESTLSPFTYYITNYTNNRKEFRSIAVTYVGIQAKYDTNSGNETSMANQLQRNGKRTKIYSTVCEC